MINKLTSAWDALFGTPSTNALPPARWLELGPNDLILLETDKALSREQRISLQTRIQEWRDGLTKGITVLDNSIRLVVVRKTI